MRVGVKTLSIIRIRCFLYLKILLYTRSIKINSIPVSFDKSEHNSRRPMEIVLFVLICSFKDKRNAEIPKRKNSGSWSADIYAIASTLMGWTKKISDKKNAGCCVKNFLNKTNNKILLIMCSMICVKWKKKGRGPKSDQIIEYDRVINGL